MVRVFSAVLGLLAVALSACTPASPVAPSAARRPADGLDYRVVLVAGDNSLPVFDNATAALRDRLVARGVSPDAIRRLSADGHVIAEDGVATASLDRTLRAVRNLHAAPGEACLFFATSHGTPGAGLYLAPVREFLSPAALDAALTDGCGKTPTVAILSACFSGNFAQGAMARDNRIVLTAARADRTSFGCGAGRDFTVYDRCVLEAIDISPTWRAVAEAAQRCVAAEEARLHVTPSLPQTWFGAAVADMPVPRLR